MKSPSLLACSSLLLCSAATTTCCSGFVIQPPIAGTTSNSNTRSTATTTTTTTALHMGLFDGVKEAFSAPALERSAIDAERETPIDRWMGWSVASTDKTTTDPSGTGTTAAALNDFVDSMDEKHYITVELSKPMGIVFEENDATYGGIFVHSLKEGGAASTQGIVTVGDQLVGVAAQKVAGQAFDDALGTILDAPGTTVPLIFFRGTAEQLYGPTGASQAWLDEFIAGKQGKQQSSPPEETMSPETETAEVSE